MSVEYEIGVCLVVVVMGIELFMLLLDMVVFLVCCLVFENDIDYMLVFDSEGIFVGILCKVDLYSVDCNGCVEDCMILLVVCIMFDIML